MGGLYQPNYKSPDHYATDPYPLLGLSLLCSENCLLCFLELLQFCTYYARFYATPQSIMLLIIHNLKGGRHGFF